MIAIRLMCVVSFLLLTACAPRPPVSEAPVNLATPPAGETPATPTDTQLAAKGNAAALAESTTKNEISPTENKKQIAASSSSTSKIASWEISGAMAARSKSKGWNVSLNWIQRGASQYQIRLSGPLSSGTVLISRNGGVVTLRDGPKTASSSNATTLLKQQTGISLPVNSLYYWIRGIPAPGSVQSEKRDQSGHLTVLRQAGYTIEYLRYTSVGKAILPSNVRLQGNGIFIKLVINRWRV